MSDYTPPINGDQRKLEDVPKSAPSVLVADGDSLTANTWPNYLAALLPGWLIVDAATGGHTFAQMQSGYAAGVAPYWSNSRGRSVVAAPCGTNNVTAGDSAATIEAAFQTYFDGAGTTGFARIAFTIPPADSWDGTQDAVQAAYNTWLRANYSTHAEVLIDLALMFPDPLDLTNYVDGTHFTAAAQQVIAAEVAAAVLELDYTAQVGTVAYQDNTDFGPVDIKTYPHQITLWPAIFYTLGMIRGVTSAGVDQWCFGHDDAQGPWCSIPTPGFAFRNRNDGSKCFVATANGTYGADVRVGLSVSELMAGVGGSIATDTTTTGNVGAGEDTLQTYSLQALSLFTDGDSLHFTYAGTVANTAAAKRLRLKWGGTTIFDTQAAGIAPNAAADWSIEGDIFRTGSSTQKCTVRVSVGTGLVAVASTDYTTAGEDLTGAVALVLTGEATNNNDLVKEIFHADFKRARSV